MGLHRKKRGGQGRKMDCRIINCRRSRTVLVAKAESEEKKGDYAKQV